MVTQCIELVKREVILFNLVSVAYFAALLAGKDNVKYSVLYIVCATEATLSSPPPKKKKINTLFIGPKSTASILKSIKHY